MKLYLCFYFFQICTSIVANNLTNVKIMGGTNADIHDFPYQVAFKYKSIIFGGVLVTRRHVLTVAHTLIGFTDVSNLKVIAGSNILKRFHAVKRRAEHILLHSLYTDGAFDYDLAIVKVAKAFDLGPKIQVATMVEANFEVPIGSLVIATGWGQLSEYSSYAKHLQKLEMSVLSDNDCFSIFNGDISERVLCAGEYDSPNSVCTGDSGGALTFNGKLLGIISSAFPCLGLHGTGSFMKVAKFRSWIDQNIQS